MSRTPRALSVLLTVPVMLAAASPAAAQSSTAGPATPDPGPIARAHVLFDDTTGPPVPGIAPGGRAGALISPKRSLGLRPLSPGGSAQGTAAATPPDPEVLGFAQAGEVTSGSWRADARLDLLSTVAYFGININGDGTINNDAGYQGWWSSQATSLINAAHAHGDRVVLTIKAFGSAGIQSIVGSAANRWTAISSVVNQLQTRGGDGVNVDFEGFTPTVSSTDYTTFVGQLEAALRTWVPNQAYLTVDTYASSAQGGSMMNIRALRAYVDAFDVMNYDITNPCSANAGPNAPLANYPYSDTQVMNEYLALVPPWQVIMGIPYYGYKWSVTTPVPQAPTGGCGGADTYAGILADFGCAQRLSVAWDARFASPWATWWSPASGDPCGGNHNSWRELYYDNAQSLGAKYDLVNGDHLRGVGIWALGYDTGSNDLWNEIAAKFTVQHGTGALPGPPGRLAGNARAVARGGDGQAWLLPGSDTATPVFGSWFYGIGSVVLGSPIAISVPNPSGPGTPYYIATGSDHNLWVMSETTTWQLLTPPPTYCTSSPAASVVEQQPGTSGSYLLVVACRGGDGALWYASGPVSADPSVPPSLPENWNSLGGQIVDGPAVAPTPPFTSLNNELTFFANGTNGIVWSRTQARGWQPTFWNCIGHLAAAGVVTSNGPLSAFACQGLDHGEWAATTTNGSWSTFSLGGSVIDGPGIALGASSWTVVVEGADHALWQTTSTAFGLWRRAGGYLASGASAVDMIPATANP